MSTAWTRARRRPRRIGRKEAEQLLTGGPVGSDRRALAEMLFGAAGPARWHEIRGKDAAVAAFVQMSRRDVHLPTNPRRRSAFVTLLTRVMSVKVASVAAALLFGGVAWAAETGSLPDPAQQVAHDLLSAVGVPAPGRDNQGATGVDEDEESVEPGRRVESSHDPQEDPRAVAELCREYKAEREQHDGQRLDPESRRRLAAAAGGEANLDSYCVKVLAEGEETTSSETTRPSSRSSATPAVTEGGAPSDTNPNSGPHS